MSTEKKHDAPHAPVPHETVPHAPVPHVPVPHVPVPHALTPAAHAQTAIGPDGFTVAQRQEYVAAVIAKQGGVETEKALSLAKAMAADKFQALHDAGRNGRIDAVHAALVEQKIPVVAVR